ncbi:MAG: Yip1 family protein [Pseudomonadales bacterium]
MFDIQATIRWATAVLQDPNGACRRYRETRAGWQQTFFQLTLPLYVAAFVVSGVLALITGGSLPLGSLSLGLFVFSVLWSLGWTFVIAFIFDYFSGTFGGKRGFDEAYAVIGLAIVPAALGTAAAPLPWIGWLLSLAASIYSLYLAYQFLPVFLEIPEASRGKHYLVSVLVSLLVNLVVSAMFIGAMAPSMIEELSREQSSASSGSLGGGLFGGLERQAGIAESASLDTWDPPADGELSDAQVRAFVDVLKKTRALTDRLGQSVQGMEEKEVGVSDVLSGVGDFMRLSTAEMEVVKTAGGNWAEHQWVRNQLEVARVQQDLNDSVAHNYELFLRYRDEIEAYE